jgi:hypothetical protein
MAQDKTKKDSKTSSTYKEQQRDWTVMIYLSGDNSLTEEMIFALTSIQQAGVPEGIQVVALLDTVGALVPYTFDSKNTGANASKGTMASQQQRHMSVVKQAGAKFLHQRALVSEASSNRDIADDLRNALIGNDRAFIGDAAGPLDRKGASLDMLNALKKLGAPRNPAPTRKKIPQLDDLLLSRKLTSLAVEDILVEFVVDSIKKYPARHYALLLSGHGSGAVGDFLTSDKQAECLNINGLSSALHRISASAEFSNGGAADGKQWLDILGFDSCLMSMAEVAFAVRDFVRFMVGSEGFEPNTGWPYGDVVQLIGQQRQDPRAVAAGIVDTHLAFYDDYTIGDLSVDLSAMDLSKIGRLATAVGSESSTKKNGLAHALIAGLQSNNAAVRDAVVMAHWEAQGYKDEQYVDLWDFCDCLAKRLAAVPGTAAIKRDCRTVQQAIASNNPANSLVFGSGFRGAAFQHSHGASVFFPWADLKDAAGTSDLDHYATLEFAEKTAWNDFIAVYFTRTIRKPRAQPAPAERRHSFVNYRPWLFTGSPSKPSEVKTPPFGPRTPPFGPRTPPFSPRTPPFSPRNVSGSPSSKISSMKNPSIDWLDS